MRTGYGSAVLLLGLYLLSLVALADFTVREATARLDQGVIRVDALIDLPLSDTALEALDNGVPLTVVIETRVESEDAWFWERALEKRKLHYELRYHPLAGLYSVTDLGRGILERFATREAALVKLGEIHDIEVVASARLEADVDYEMALRAYLDIESLPLPLRPLAYIYPSWHLSTGWSRWQLRL